jgi:hypothetical protein
MHSPLIWELKNKDRLNQKLTGINKSIFEKELLKNPLLNKWVFIFYEQV